MLTLATALFLGTAIGMLTGFFGAGGGFILTPALHMFLGMDMVIAVGTGAMQISCTSALTLCQRFDRKMTGLGVALWCAIGILPGCWLGAQTVQLLTRQGGEFANRMLMVFFAVLLLLVAAGMLLEQSGNDSRGEKPGLLQGVRIPPFCASPALPHGTFSIPVLVLMGVCMGLLSGLLGIGGGVVMLPMMLYLVGQPAKCATLTSTVLVFISATGSALLHLYHGHVNFKLLAVLAAGSALGSFLGVRLQKKCDAPGLKRKFVWVVFAALAMILIKLLRGILS